MNHNIWLNSLASKRTFVSLTLLSRRVVLREDINDAHSFGSMTLQPTAICKMRYWPRKSIWSEDLGSTLVNSGNARVASGMHVDNLLTKTIDSSMNIADLKSDIKYVEQLGKDEFEAIKSFRGIWADDRIRKENADLVNEAEVEVNAGIIKRIWKRLVNYFYY
mmetsp:Transcript_3342/g.4688  ORF Transcript_3342/g.4688 Transcript_3342/m.4688 type:complete len:163 (-) Transcript_3342:831-1319(-)